MVRPSGVRAMGIKGNIDGVDGRPCEAGAACTATGPGGPDAQAQVVVGQ